MKKILLATLYVLFIFAGLASARSAYWVDSTASLAAIDHLDSKGACAATGGTCTGATCSTGGNICVNLATNNVAAIIKETAGTEKWLYDSTSTATHDGSTVVQPNSNAGAGRWHYVGATITEAERAKLGYISVAQAVDLDTIASDTTTNNAKVTNATHTGDVAGSDALTIQPGAVDIAMLSATGTKDATTFLRGDNVFSVPTGGGDMLQSTYDANADDLIDDTAIATTIARDSEIPTAVSSLANDSGYITSYTVTESDVTAHQAALTITEAQISDLAHAVDTVLNETQVDAYVANNGYAAATDVSLNTTHRTSSGADHTWLGQDLRTTASPTFAGVTINGDDGNRAVSLLDNTVAVGCLAGDYRIYPQNGVWKKCESGTITDVGAGASSGDMLKSVYDANTDNLIDDTAIAATIARDSEIPTAVSALTNDSGFISGYTETDPTAEPALGNPASDGYVLSSTAAGSRSWVSNAGGGSGGHIIQDAGTPMTARANLNFADFTLTDDLANDATVVNLDLSEPPAIGGTTPAPASFTTLIADTFDWGTPATGTTGEMALLEDPANGTNSTTLKAAADIAADVVLTLPGVYGVDGQVWTTNATGTMGWSDAVLDSDIGVTVQAYDDDLADLAGDGSLTGSKVGTGISGTNITTGTVAESYIDAAIARDTELNPALATPALATDVCTAGTWSYDATHYYLCTTTDIVAAKADVSFTLATSTINSPTDPIGTNAIVGHSIVITGSTSNTGTFTVASITDANNIVVTEVLVDEVAGATVTVQQDSWLRATLAAW